MIPSADGLVGSVLGGYKLLRVLGSGGAGTVYLAAKEDAPDQQAAIKVLMPSPQASTTDREEFKARFQREAKALQLLKHPHILSLLGYGEDAETQMVYMVLPYMAGGTLATRLTQGALPLADTARYISQVAEALDYAHDQGIVHRDVKPGNILLDKAGEAYLADFGIAKILESAGTTLMTITNTGQVMGTLDYMSPEQARGEKVGAASDVYSLGMVLYCLVTGKVPFEASSVPQLMLQITQDLPAPPRQRRPELPPAAEAAILRALNKKPADRFASAGGLASAYALGLKGESAPETETRIPKKTVKVLSTESRLSALARPLVLVAALLIVAIVSTLFLLHNVFGAIGTMVSVSPTATTTRTSTPGSPTGTASPAHPTATRAPTQPGGGSGGTGGNAPSPTPTKTVPPPPPPVLGAVVNSDGSLVRGSSVTTTSHLGTGRYEITFSRDVSACAYTATIGDPGNAQIPDFGLIFTAGGHASGGGADSHGVYVETKNIGGGLSDFSFHLTVSCSGVPYAVINMDGSLVRGSSVTTTSHLGTGRYEITYSQDISKCAYTATIGDPANGLVYNPGFVYTAGGHASGGGADPHGVYVETKNTGGGLGDWPFHLAVSCSAVSYAVVNSDGSLVRGNSVSSTTHLGTGQYEVTFSRDVSACAYTASIGDPANGLVYNPGLIFTAGGHASGGGGDPDGVYVDTKAPPGGGLGDWPFHLSVSCG